MFKFIISIILLFILYKIRYANIFRHMFLKLLTPTKKVIFINSITDIEKINKVLESKVKGIGIESILASPAWLPIYNVESVDGREWSTLKILVIKLLHKIDLTNVSNIAKNLTKKMFLNKQVIYSDDISLLTANIFHNILFESNIPTNLENLFLNASTEWKKEISIKGKGDSNVKNKFVEYISTKLGINYTNTKLTEEDIFSISSVAQPFFISPMINFGDIIVSVFENIKSIRELYSIDCITNMDCKHIILESIRLSHPFPILERDVVQDNKIVHVYIELDNFKQDSEFRPKRWISNTPYSNIPFGTGPRKCPGKQLALVILEEMLLIILKHNNVQVKVDHKYSGRNNDKVTSVSEISYIFLKLVNLFLERFLDIY